VKKKSDCFPGSTAINELYGTTAVGCL